MPLDDDIVPPHCTLTPSVTMPLLKRVLPEDIARLRAGASIIIVIPPSSKAMSSVVRARRHFYSRAFDQRTYIERQELGDKSMSVVHALCMLLLRLWIIDIAVKEEKKEGGNKTQLSGMGVVLRLGRMNDSMAILSDRVCACVLRFEEERDGGGVE